MNHQNEVPKYRKKSSKCAPKKHHHKHVYRDCILEWDDPHGKYTHEKGFLPQHKVAGSSYCIICGKLHPDFAMSFEWGGMCQQLDGCIWEYQLSDRAVQERDPSTRTIPTFYTQSRWDKYVPKDQFEKERNSHEEKND